MALLELWEFIFDSKTLRNWFQNLHNLGPIYIYIYIYVDFIIERRRSFGKVPCHIYHVARAKAVAVGFFILPEGFFDALNRFCARLVWDSFFGLLSHLHASWPFGVLNPSTQLAFVLATLILIVWDLWNTPTFGNYIRWKLSAVIS